MSAFKPAWWLPGGHLQTIYPTLAKKPLNIPTTRERFELPDDDFIDIDWAGDFQNPIAIVLHGLGGNIHSPYAISIIESLVQHHWCVAFMHFRGCSGEPNRQHRTYHSGETSDLQIIASTLKQRYPHQALCVIGYSLGGNVLLKWLGESSQNTLLTAAIAISVPFELAKVADRMRHGFSRLYQHVLLSSLKQTMQMKFAIRPPPFEAKDLNTLNNFWLFDDHITAPLHGFANVHDYYRQASCRQYLSGIQTPTLIIHAKDDPFMTPEIIPSVREVSENVTLDIQEYGGHVGFIQGNTPCKAQYWLSQRIPAFLDKFVK